MWRRWLYVIVTASLVIGIIAGAEILSLASESYPQRQSYSHNQYQPVYASLVQLLLGGWHWLRDNIDHDTITTIAIRDRNWWFDTEEDPESSRHI